MSDELLALFRKTGALLDGHFVLRSGLHSRQFFQCALLLQHTDIAARRVRTCSRINCANIECDAVISPALGGIIVGQEVGRALGKRHIFAEKDAAAVWSCVADLRFRLTRNLSSPKTSSRGADACRKPSTSCVRQAASSRQSA